MGIALPQLAPASEDRVSGAQVIDGSLRFDGSKSTRLTKTFASAGNRTSWTWSCWVKRDILTLSNRQVIFGGYGASNDTDWLELGFDSSNDKVYFTTNNISTAGTAERRDPNGWYHFFSTYDGSNLKIYVNNNLDLNHSFSGNRGIGNNTAHYIGQTPKNTVDRHLDGRLTQCYFIDGQALVPEFFGYTDPLTGVWRPRGKLKKTVNDGTNFTADITNTGSTLNNPGRIFDGTIDSDATIASGAATITYTPSTPIKYANSVRVMGSGSPSSPYNARWQLNGGSNVSTVNANQFVTLDSGNGGGTITSIKLTVDTGGANWRAIEVDGVIMKANAAESVNFGTNGFYLPMDGNSPIGQDQAPSPNDGTVWSSGWSGTNMSGYNKEESFDGTTNTNGNNATRVEVNQTLTWTNPKTSTPFTTLRLWAADDTGTIRVNGVDVSGQIGAGYAQVQWFTITGVGSALETIELVGGSGIAPFLWAVEIDGTILVDGQSGNSWTPVNFGGSTDITKATGAKPILNTINGGTVARPGVFGSDVSATYTTTSASNSGGQYYFSHDSSAKPTFSFVRGATYTFDYSASSSHPLRFATAADAAGSTEYTNGTSISGNVIKFTVPHNAPDTLYYYCNVHNGMGNSISVTTDETKADPYAWKCTVAMPLLDYASGTRADFSHDLNCTTASKSTDYDAITDFANPGGMFYDKVAKFVGDGSNDRVRIPTGSFAMGTGDFTIEFWGHFTATGDQGNRNARILTPQSETGNYFQFLSSTSAAKVQFKYNGGGDSDIAIPNSVCLNRTRHYVYQRTGTTGQLIVDGVLYDTGTDNVNYPDVAYQIGRYDASNGGASLYMSDLRVYTGIQKYSTTGKSIGDQLFIPASTSPDILPDTPSGVAVKSKLTKITDGAVSISRSSDDYLQVPASTNFRLDGQYCIEFFLKLTEYSNDSTYVRTFVLDGPTGDGGSTNIHLNVNPSSGVMILWNGSSELISAQLHVTGNWRHICLTRDSSNKTRLFVDGVLSGSATINTDYDINSGSPRPRLGALGTTGGTSGYYSNWRIIKGSIPTEYQTSTTTNFDRAFYPPTEPLTTTSQGATANDVKLLTCQTLTTYQIAAVAPLVSGVNSGTVWSSSVTSDSLFRSGFPAADAFNGTTKSSTNDCAATPQTAGQGFAFTFGEGVPFTTLQMQCDDNNGGKVFVNGVDITSQLPTGSLTNTTITGVTSPLTSIRLISTTGDALYLGSVTIDGTMLVDPLTPNGDAVTTNFNPFNTDINTVRGQEGAYATWNTLDIQGLDAGDLKDGNLSITHPAGNWLAVRANKFVSSGKWYYEVKVGNNQYTTFGVGSVDYDLAAGGNDWCNVANVYGFYPYSGNVYDAGTSRSYATGDTSAAGNVYGIAIDMDNKSLRFYKNGKDLGVAFDSTTATNFVNKESVAPMAWLYNQSGTDEYNFGQKPFKFPPPDGFQPLTSSTARPDTVIAHPDQYVSATLYTGNTDSSQDIDVGFAPDLVWQKIRSQAGDNALTDTVRGISGGYLQSEDPDVQKGNANDGISAFLPNGFRAYNSFNNNGLNWVSWCWKAGGSSNTFNIDDVGYANASDVNMNVGGLNSAAYDQSQRWRDNITSSNGWNTSYPVTNIFNGSFDGGGGAANNGGGGVVTFTPPAAITVTKLELSCYNPVTLTLPDGTTREVAGVGSANKDVTVDIGSGFSFTGSNSITISRTGGFIYLERIKINGKELVDNDISLNLPSVANTGCSVGTKQGFSIVAYNATGSDLTVNHGLSEKPGFIILKSKNVSGDWLVWHQSLSSDTHFMKLNATQSESQASNVFLSVDSNTFATGNDAGINSSNQQKIAYIWHDVPGLQKFGRYSGNGSSSGPFLECGFRPAIILLKKINNTDANSGWHWYDNKRNTYNPANNFLLAGHNYYENRAANNTADIGSYTVDFLSNGFRLSHSSNNLNTSGSNYIYAAWAEAPSFNLYGAQSNAR